METPAVTKRPWYEIEPSDAVDIVLPHPDIQGPFNENGEECPWPWEPIQLKGQPLGQYRCRYCMAMCVAGLEHTDYGEKDEDGLSWLDREYLEYVRNELREQGLDEDEVMRQAPAPRKPEHDK